MSEERYRNIRKSLEEAYTILGDAERRLLTSSDPKERMRLRRDIEETKAQIASLEQQLRNPSAASSAQSPTAPNFSAPYSQGAIGNVHGNVTQHIYNGTNNITQKGDIKMGDEIHIRDIINSNVNIKSRLDKVKQTVQAMPKGSEQDKKTLEDLVEQLKTQLTAVPAEHTAAAEEVSAELEDTVNAAKRSKPDTEEVKKRGERLIAAAQNLSKVAAPVAATAIAIVNAISQITK